MFGRGDNRPAVPVGRAALANEAELRRAQRLARASRNCRPDFSSLLAVLIACRVVCAPEFGVLKGLPFTRSPQHALKMVALAGLNPSLPGKLKTYEVRSHRTPLVGEEEEVKPSTQHPDQPRRGCAKAVSRVEPAPAGPGGAGPRHTAAAAPD